MSAITTHVLDIAHGRPAAGVAVLLERCDATAQFCEAGRGVTDADGRVKTLLASGTGLAVGAWRLTFETGAYFRAAGVVAFHPSVTITFEVVDAAQHYHVPLLVSPFGYTTYRGS
ncbi:MAG: hydroxyisourate hydrolase [Candidatus Eisenbacteria bacterium]